MYEADKPKQSVYQRRRLVLVLRVAVWKVQRSGHLSTKDGKASFVAGNGRPEFVSLMTLLFFSTSDQNLQHLHEVLTCPAQASQQFNTKNAIAPALP